jgi:hypothetical protein
MNKAEMLAMAQGHIDYAQGNPGASQANTRIEIAKALIMMANATESMNVLTDKELAQAKRNVELLKIAIESAQDMKAFGGELGVAGHVLFDRIAYG